MPYIEIREQDNTRQASLGEMTDVVYVPGFVCIDPNINDSIFDIERDEDTNEIISSEYKGIEPFKPTLFTSVSEFESACGTIGVQFDKDQLYADTSVSTVNGPEGFSEFSIPFSGVMFHKGEYDPGYIMAKELLAAGLPVLFERVNRDEELSTTPIKTDDKPDNWETVYTNYVQLADSYKHITSATAPTFMLLPANGTKYDAGTTYYTRSVKMSETNPEVIEGWTFTKVEDNNTVEKTIDGIVEDKISTKPEDSIIYFYKDENAHKYFEFIETPVGEGNPTFEKDKFAVPTSDDRGFRVLSEEGEDFKKGAVVYKIVDLSAGENTDLFKVDESSYFISSEWANNYARGNGKSTYLVKGVVNISATETFNTDNDKYPYFEKLSGTTVADMYNALSNNVYDVSAEDGLIDKGNYSVKYLTSGGYPVYEYRNGELVTKMKNLAYQRGDCVALIDHTYMPERNMNIDKEDSLYYQVTHDNSFTSTPENSYAAMFTPWCKYTRVSTDEYSQYREFGPDEKDLAAPATTVIMPASFAYLTSLADSIKTYANWMAVAGVTRGMVQHLASDGIITDIPNGVADKMSTEHTSGIYINPITNIRPYGQAIWGNRTLIKNEDNTSTQATSFLSIRNLVSDIKKLCYTVCRRLTFEPNSEQLWTNIQAGIMPTLDRMQSGYGISGYQLAINKDHPQYGRHATFCFKIILYPIYPVERFFINVILQDNEVTFE